MENADATEDDPFDCSAVAIPSPTTLVDETIDEFVRQWKQLDARKIIENDDDDDSNKEDSDEDNRSRKRAKKADWSTIGWHAHRLKIPENFDYASRRQEPPPEIPSGKYEKVISLLNPTLQLSYEHELWKLFHAVPTLQELEYASCDGHQIPQTFRLHGEITEALRENGRLDGHALSRMRLNDRHGLPAPRQDSSDNLVSSIRFEIWRRQQQPKRGSSPDPHRLVIEFLADQTLRDVHLAIVELSQDDLWDDNDGDEHDKANETCDGVTRLEQGLDPSGVFFVEGVFYTCGKVNYAEPIRKWLDPDNKVKDCQSRLAFLGITPQPPNGETQEGSFSELLPVRAMDQARLVDITWRLGVRYYHAHHGDVESALFVSDIRHGAKHDMPYPLIHDMWCPSYPMTECEACQHRPAVLVTPPSCTITDGGPRVICERCFVHLKQSLVDGNQQHEHGELNVTRYSIWRDQPDLSLAASSDAFF